MLLGFKKQFVPKIQDGSKDHTIRDFRKHPPKIGERLYMYTGLRTKQCEHITSLHKCLALQVIVIRIRRARVGYWVSIYVDGRKLKAAEMQLLAVRDGFESLDAFCTYWLNGKARLPKKERQLIHWSKNTY